MEKLSPEGRSDLARHAATKRWKRIEENGAASTREGLPVAKYTGTLRVSGSEIPAYVLSNGERVIARISATEWLTGVKRQGDLESYLRAESLRPFVNVESVVSRMTSFRHPDVEMVNEHVKGLSSDLFIEICRGYVAALEASLQPDSGVSLTARQAEIAVKASIFLAACAKIGLDALIDEATGYQYERPGDALELKLRLYLAEEMRKWEKTFPDELWEQFGRLTNWKGKIHHRPKYWGKLVMKLIYQYLDTDVAQWLTDNAPKPHKGENYHQWLSDQYGLKKLTEHIWKVVGIASACSNMSELERKLEELYGKRPGFQFALKLVDPTSKVI